jgi:hypothetical protein
MCRHSGSRAGLGGPSGSALAEQLSSEQSVLVEDPGALRLKAIDCQCNEQGNDTVCTVPFERPKSCVFHKVVICKVINLQKLTVLINLQKLTVP